MMLPDGWKRDEARKLLGAYKSKEVGWEMCLCIKSRFCDPALINPEALLVNLVTEHKQIAKRVLVELRHLAAAPSQKAWKEGRHLRGLGGSRTKTPSWDIGGLKNSTQGEEDLDNQPF